MIATRTIMRACIAISMLAACSGMGVSEKLNLIDSLVVREQYDSAYAILSDLDKPYMSPDERAHFNLLSTQLGYLTSHPLPSDSMLNEAIAYYGRVGNSRKLSEAYYYKSVGAECHNDYPQAILYCKQADQLSLNTDDARLQFKIAESLSYLNGQCGNAVLQLQYAKRALSKAQKLNNGNWTAYSLNNMIFAFASVDQYDSAFAYIEKTIPYLEYVYDHDKAGFLTNIGLLYKDKSPDRAKELFEEALKYDVLPETLEHLADVYYSEGNHVKAYSLWKDALRTGGERLKKDNLIHSIISYDLEHGNIEEVSKNIDEIISIKDSILNKLKTDTIKDLQLRFDHEVAMHEADKKLATTQKLLLGLAILLVLMAFYAYMRRKKAEAREKDYQERLYAYTTEISELTANRDKALADIREMKRREERDQQEISRLEENAREAEAAIRQLNKSIRKMLDDEAPKLKQGKMLYDEIAEGRTIVNWHSREKELFNNYYAAVNYQSYNRLKKVKRATPLSAHNMFYLILKEMGYSDEEVRRIMGLSPEGLRSLRSRTKPAGPRDS